MLIYTFETINKAIKTNTPLAGLNLDFSSKFGLIGVDTKQRLSKQRHHKTATVTKQRLLQNSDYYKTKTVAKNIFLYIQQKPYVKKTLDLI